MPAKKLFKTREIFLSTTIFAITQKEPTTEVDRKFTVFVHESSDALNNALALYGENGNVPVQDFISAYKTLRAKMYAARG